MSRKRQLGVALHDELRERIEALASESGRSIADEIRRRLERTLSEDAIDPKTRELADDVRSLAEMVFGQHQIHWHEDVKSYDALREAVLTWLDAHKPSNTFTEPTAWGDDDPKTVGRIVTRDLAVLKQAEKFLEKEMLMTRASIEMHRHEMARLEAAYAKLKVGKDEQGKS